MYTNPRLIKPARPNVVDFATNAFFDPQGVIRIPMPRDIVQQRTGDVTIESVAKPVKQANELKK